MPASSPTATSLIQFSFVFTSLVTVIGWFVVGYLADRRDIRKEVRENITELKSRAQSVRDWSKKYWVETAGKEAAAAACTLKAEIDSLSRQLRVLQRFDFQIDEMLIVYVRQSATGGDFERKGRRRSERDIGTLTDVHGAIEDLLSAIDLTFHEKFRRKRSRGWTKLPFISILFLASDST